MQSVQQITPRLMDDVALAQYTGFSRSWHRNTRYEDARRVAAGEEAIGVPCYKIGRSIRYYLEDVDAWLNRIKEGNHPALKSDFQADITNLRNLDEVV